MASGIRPRLPDLEEPADLENVDGSFVPAARVSRKPPPTIASGKQVSSAISQNQPQRKVSVGNSHNEGDRFDLDLQVPTARAPLAVPTSSGLLGDIKENTRHTVQEPLRPLQGTGFPVAQRRPQVSSKPKESRFKASLRQKAEANGSNATLPKPVQPASTSETTKVFKSHDDPLHAEIHAENNQKLGEMSEEEILEAQKELMAMLGGDMVEFLRSRNVVLPDEDFHSGTSDQTTDASVSNTTPKAAMKDSEVISHKLRSVRFNDQLSYSNPPSRSPSPPPVRQAILLPAPDSAFSLDTGRSATDSSRMVFDDDPEAIRRKYFPEEPLSANLDWMRDPSSSENRDESTSQDPHIRFDLSGQTHVTGTEYHAHEGHRHAGSGDKLTLIELLELSKSAVMGQRVLAFQVLLKAFSLHSTEDSEASEVLMKSDNVTAIIEACARGLADKSIGVVAAALALMEQYAAVERTRLNTAAAILTVKPAPLESFSYLLSANYDLPHMSALAILSILHTLLNTREDFVSAEIVEAPFLLENVGSTFLQVPWPPTSGSSPPDPRACELFSTIIAMSRNNAENLIIRRVEQSVLRYIAVQPWQLEEQHQDLGYRLAAGALDVFTAYARYGLGCSTCTTSAALFREIEDHITAQPFKQMSFTKSWLDLLEAWCFCAIDPHSTTPEHDILWAETKDWGEHLFQLLLATGERQDIPLTISRRLVAAMSAWLEGARKHNHPVYDDMVEKLDKQGKPIIVSLVEAAAEEPVTEEKAKTLLAIKALVRLAELQLGDAAGVLNRVEVEPIAEEAPVNTADPEADDKGWIQ